MKKAVRYQLSAISFNPSADTLTASVSSLVGQAIRLSALAYREAARGARSKLIAES